MARPPGQAALWTTKRRTIATGSKSRFPFFGGFEPDSECEDRVSFAFRATTAPSGRRFPPDGREPRLLLPRQTGRTIIFRDLGKARGDAVGAPRGGLVI